MYDIETAFIFKLAIKALKGVLSWHMWIRPKICIRVMVPCIIGSYSRFFLTWHIYESCTLLKRRSPVISYAFFSRTKGLGLCSGIGRLGAILGIILGEYKKLHLSTPVQVVAGASTLISAFLILALPDLTQQKMPQTLNEIEVMQFSSKTQSQIQENNDS